jgi:signal transduction histidine kinase
VGRRGADHRRLAQLPADVPRAGRRAHGGRARRRLDELKEQFISSVNHELRNPVMAMLGYLELLQDPDNRESAAREMDLLTRANQAGLNLRALLNNILDARRLDQGADDFTPEPVDVRAVLEAAAALIDPREAKMVERPLRLEMPEGLVIWGERLRLQQIFINLLSNALKYSAPGTPVELRAWVVSAGGKSGPLANQPANQPANQLANQLANSLAGRFGRRPPPRPMAEIVVRDYGLGVPPDQIPLLFQRFTRLPRDLTSNVVGNGLGLHRCRTFAEAMGGRIWVESSGVEGEGAAFHLRLPLPPVEPAPAEYALAESALAESLSRWSPSLSSQAGTPASCWERGAGGPDGSHPCAKRPNASTRPPPVARRKAGRSGAG